MRARHLATGLTVALAIGGLGTAPAASAAPTTPAAPAQASSRYPVPLVGDFTGDAREELFVYFPGTVPDSLVSFTRSGNGFSTQKSPFQVNGTGYRPVVADVDADPQDEIVWYAPGTGTDSIWDFTSTTTRVSRPLTVNGHYQPIAGNFTGDGNDDIFWWAPGTAQDHMWAFADDGSVSTTLQDVDGSSYLPVVGSFGRDATDDIVWYDPGPGPDTMFDFKQGDAGHGHVWSRLDVSRVYDPIGLDAWGDGARGGDIFWYGYGTSPDHLWDHRDGVLAASLPQQANQHHDPLATGDFFGDGADDVLFFRDFAFDVTRSAALWDHVVDGTTLRRNSGDLVRSDWVDDGGTPVPHAWNTRDQVVATR